MGFLARFIGKPKGARLSAAPAADEENGQKFPFDELYSLQAKLSQGSNVLDLVDDAISKLGTNEIHFLQLAYFVSNIASVLDTLTHRFDHQEGRKTPIELVYTREKLESKTRQYYEKAGIFFERVWDTPVEKWDERRKATRTAFATELCTRTIEAYVKSGSIRGAGFALKSAHWWIITGIGQPDEQRLKYFAKASDVLEAACAATHEPLAKFLRSQQTNLQAAMRELDGHKDVYELIAAEPEVLEEMVSSYEKLIANLESADSRGLAGNLSENLANAISWNKRIDSPTVAERFRAIARRCYERAALDYQRQAEMEASYELVNVASWRYNQAFWASKRSGKDHEAEKIREVVAGLNA